MLVADRRFVCKRGVLVGLVRVSCRSGAKVQNPEDTMTQKKRAYEKQCEQSTSRPTEETQATVLPATTRHSTHNLIRHSFAETAYPKASCLARPSPSLRVPSFKR